MRGGYTLGKYNKKVVGGQFEDDGAIEKKRQGWD